MGDGRSRAVDDAKFDNAIDSLSSFLDDNIFSQIFTTIEKDENKSTAVFFRENLKRGGLVGMRGRLGVVEDQLKSTKVFASVIFVLGFLTFAKGFSTSNLLRLGAGLWMVYDGAIIAYHCYLDKYYSLVTYKLAGTVSNCTQTALQWLQSNVQKMVTSQPKDNYDDTDPFEKYKKSIMWSIVLEGTLSMALYEKVCAVQCCALCHMSSHRQSLHAYVYFFFACSCNQWRKSQHAKTS